jgi:hypothetical protein
MVTDIPGNFPGEGKDGTAETLKFKPDTKGKMYF